MVPSLKCVVGVKHFGCEFIIGVMTLRRQPQFDDHGDGTNKVATERSRVMMLNQKSNLLLIRAATDGGRLHRGYLVGWAKGDLEYVNLRLTY